MSDRTIRLVGLYSVVAAVGALLVAPLVALSYFATSDGAAELERGTVSAWADPARDLAGGLLTWSDPDRVYGTFWLLFWLLFPAVFLCARTVHARRRPRGRAERWGWRAALLGYGLGIAGVVVAAGIAVQGASTAAVIDVVFFAVMLPAMAIDVLGSTLLGIALLRTGYAPRATPWLLALMVPSIVVVPIVLGNLSLGLLPLFFAWAVTGRRLWRDGAPAEPGLAGD